jgi:protein TonB
MKSWSLAGLALAAVVGVCNAGAEETARGVKPNEWVTRPSADEAARYYPDRAQRMDVSGRAVLDCRLTMAGKLEDCRAISEYPADYQFADRAIKLTQFMQLVPPTKKDVRKGTTRRILPMVFSAPH